MSALPVEIAAVAASRKGRLFEAARAVWEAFDGNVHYAAAFALTPADDLRRARALTLWLSESRSDTV